MVKQEGPKSDQGSGLPSLLSSVSGLTFLKSHRLSQRLKLNFLELFANEQIEKLAKTAGLAIPPNDSSASKQRPLLQRATLMRQVVAHIWGLPEEVRGSAADLCSPISRLQTASSLVGTYLSITKQPVDKRRNLLVDLIRDLTDRGVTSVCAYRTPTPEQILAQANNAAGKIVSAAQTTPGIERIDALRSDVPNGYSGLSSMESPWMGLLPKPRAAQFGISIGSPLFTNAAAPIGRFTSPNTLGWNAALALCGPGFIPSGLPYILRPEGPVRIDDSRSGILNPGLAYKVSMDATGQHLFGHKVHENTDRAVLELGVPRQQEVLQLPAPPGSIIAEIYNGDTSERICGWSAKHWISGGVLVQLPEGLDVYSLRLEFIQADSVRSKFAEMVTAIRTMASIPKLPDTASVFGHLVQDLSLLLTPPLKRGGAPLEPRF